MPSKMKMCVESDTLQFRVQLKDQPLTRTGILSTVSSVFNPLGMLVPSSWLERSSSKSYVVMGWLGFGEPKTVDLHHFSDASKDAYGQCSYLRLTNDSGQIHCSLAMAKSRMGPLKPVTIPRLKLAAALVSLKISDVLH